MEFIHTTAGCPVYFEIYDNYLEICERLIDELDVFHDGILPGVEKRTLIIDIGVCGRDKMIEIDLEFRRVFRT